MGKVVDQLFDRSRWNGWEHCSIVRSRIVRRASLRARRASQSFSLERLGACATTKFIKQQTRRRSSPFTTSIHYSVPLSVRPSTKSVLTSTPRPLIPRLILQWPHVPLPAHPATEPAIVPRAHPAHVYAIASRPPLYLQSLPVPLPLAPPSYLQSRPKLFRPLWPANIQCITYSSSFCLQASLQGE